MQNETAGSFAHMPFMHGRRFASYICRYSENITSDISCITRKIRAAFCRPLLHKHAELVGFRQSCEHAMTAQTLDNGFVQLRALDRLFNRVKRFYRVLLRERTSRSFPHAFDRDKRQQDFAIIDAEFDRVCLAARARTRSRARTSRKQPPGSCNHPFPWRKHSCPWL